MTDKNAVDFNNPEALADELAAVAATEATPKKPKVKKPRTIKVSYTLTEDVKAGETIEFMYEIPVGQSRVVNNKPVEEMTDDELRIEYRNSKSVQFKSKKAGKNTEAQDARVDRCVAEMDKRGLAPTSRGSKTIDAAAIAKLIQDGTVKAEDIEAILAAM